MAGLTKGIVTSLAILVVLGALFVVIRERFTDVGFDAVRTDLGSASEPRQAPARPSPWEDRWNAAAESIKRGEWNQEYQGRLQKALEPMRLELAVAFNRLDASGPRCGAQGVLLVLSLESGDGVVYVRGVKAEGTAELREDSPEGHEVAPAIPADLANCLTLKFNGAVIQSPSAIPGRTWEYPYWPELPPEEPR